MSEEQISKLKGIAAMLEYMSSAEKMDILYTKEALGVLSEQLYALLGQDS